MFILILSPFIVSSRKPKEVTELYNCKKDQNITSDYLYNFTSHKKLGAIKNVSLEGNKFCCKKVTRLFPKFMYYLNSKIANYIEYINSGKEEKQYNTQSSNQDNPYFKLGIIVIILMDLSLFIILYKQVLQTKKPVVYN
jgi:hypothetical protein